MVLSLDMWKTQQSKGNAHVLCGEPHEEIMCFTPSNLSIYHRPDLIIIWWGRRWDESLISHVHTIQTDAHRHTRIYSCTGSHTHTHTQTPSDKVISAGTIFMSAICEALAWREQKHFWCLNYCILPKKGKKAMGIDEESEKNKWQVFWKKVCKSLFQCLASAPSLCVTSCWSNHSFHCKKKNTLPLFGGWDCLCSKLSLKRTFAHPDLLTLTVYYHHFTANSSLPLDTAKAPGKTWRSLEELYNVLQWK